MIFDDVCGQFSDRENIGEVGRLLETGFRRRKPEKALTSAVNQPSFNYRIMAGVDVGKFLEFLEKLESFNGSFSGRFWRTISHISQM